MSSNLTAPTIIRGLAILPDGIVSKIHAVLDSTGEHMAALDRVTQDILKFFAKSNARAGHAFNVKGFSFGAMNNYSPKEKDSIEEAMKQLVSEGFVEEKGRQHLLTQKGYDHIYP